MKPAAEQPTCSKAVHSSEHHTTGWMQQSGTQAHLVDLADEIRSMLQLHRNGEVDLQATARCSLQARC